MHTGYMLFIRVFSKIWHNKDNNLLLWGLQQEYGRPFLGIAAKLWNMLNDIQKNRWKMLALSDYYNIETEKSMKSLEEELKDHISTVLGLKLVYE